MSRLLVTSEEVTTVSGNLSRGAEDISQQLSAMESQVKGLIEANWQGTASDAFHGLWEKWHTGARQIREALTGISGMLGETAKVYADTESQLTSKLSG